MATNDVLSIRFMMEVVNNIPIPRNYIGLRYLPYVPVSSAELTWDVLKDEQNLAGLYSIDGKIMPGHEPIFGQMFADVCRIGGSRVVSEDEYRKLRDPGMIGIETGLVADLRAEAERKIAKKLAACNREVDATVEYLIMNALQGYISWPPPGLNTTPALGNAVFKLDYNFPSDHKINVSSNSDFGGYYWTDATNADIVKAMEQSALVLEDDAGVDASNLDVVMTRHVLKWALQQSKFVDIVKYTNPSGILNFGLAQGYLETTLGIRIVIYSAQYTYRTVSATDPSDITINRVRFLNTNKVIVMPRGVKLGDMATSPSKANNWQTGKFTWNKEEQNPWRDEIGVGINAFPRLTTPEAILVLQVAADPTGLKTKK